MFKGQAHWSLLLSDVIKRVLRRGRFKPSRPSQPTLRAFDPSILQNFELQISTWPADQASAALHVIRSTLTGDRAEIDQFFGKLTVAQVRAVNEVVRQIHGGN